MALKTFVKISGITNLTDARYCAGMYVDLLGFSLESEHPRSISTTQFGEITGWITGVEFVGEFEKYSVTETEETLQNYSEIKWIEHERIEVLMAFEKKGLGLIYKTTLEDVLKMGVANVEKLSKSGILFHISSTDQQLNSDDLEALKRISTYCKVILGTAISPKNVTYLVNDLNLEGIALTGGDEIKPGLKDFDELADILEALEIED